MLESKKPKAFLLENVPHLLKHDKGKTFETILDVLENDLNYRVFYNIINAKNFGLPQNRPRILIVGFRKDSGVEKFDLPKSNGLRNRTIAQIKEKEVPSHYYVSKVWYEGMKKHRKRHENKGNGFGFMVIGDNEISNTLVCGGMGKERNLLVDKESIKSYPKDVVKKINTDLHRHHPATTDAAWQTAVRNDTDRPRSL